MRDVHGDGGIVHVSASDFDGFIHETIERSAHTACVVDLCAVQYTRFSSHGRCLSYLMTSVPIHLSSNSAAEYI